MASSAPVEAAVAPDPGEISGSPIRKSRFRIGGLLIAILVAYGTFALISPSHAFLTPLNQFGILRAMSSIVIASLGLMLVIMSGEIDLSFGYVYGLASMLVGVLWVNAGWPVGIALGSTFLVCVGIGVVNAVLTTVAGIPSFVVTLGTGQLIFGTTLLISGAQTLNPAYPPTGKSVDQGDLAFFGGLSNVHLPFGIPGQAVWMLGAALLVHILLRGTLFGFRLRAIGGNPVAARMSALPVRRYRAVAFVACSLAAGLAGVLDFSFISSVQPNGGISLLFPVISAVVIGGVSLSGGRGTVGGVLAGALLLGIIGNGLSLVALGPYVVNYVFGTVTIAAVAIDMATTRRSRRAAPI